MSCLSIVVPYRARERQLSQFVPHLLQFFQRRDSGMPTHYRITIVEQSGNDPFNRGMLCNIGHLLTKDVSDYVCFHDVDYLPVIADYSYPPNPTRIIWHGAAARPIVIGGQSVIRHDYLTFFGAVVMFNHQHLAQVNGFSNEYWGWGFEDADLRLRCLVAGMQIDLRDGVFQPLHHANENFSPDGQLNDKGSRNLAAFVERRDKLCHAGIPADDGLSTCRFSIEHESAVVNPMTGDQLAHVSRVLVRFAA
jgi:hypothetical protein